MALSLVSAFLLAAVFQVQGNSFNSNSLYGNTQSPLSNYYGSQPQNQNDIFQRIGRANGLGEGTKYRLLRSVNGMDGKINPLKVQELNWKINNLYTSYTWENQFARNSNELYSIGSKYYTQLQDLEKEIKELVDAIALADRNTAILTTQLRGGIADLKGKISDQEILEMEREVDRILQSFLIGMKQSSTGPQLDQARAASMPAVLALRAKITKKTEQVGAVKMGYAQANLLRRDMEDSVNNFVDKINPRKVYQLRTDIDQFIREYETQLITNTDVDAVLSTMKPKLDKIRGEIKSLDVALGVAATNRKSFGSDLRNSIQGLQGKISEQEFNDLNAEVVRIETEFDQKRSQAMNAGEIDQARAHFTPALNSLSSRIRQRYAELNHQ